MTPPPPFETLYPPYECVLLKDAHIAVTLADAWSWLATYDPPTGFLFSTEPMLDRITAAMVHGGEHSGASWAYTMRVMQSIAKRGWEAHRNLVREKLAVAQLTKWAATQTRPKPT